MRSLYFLHIFLYIIVHIYLGKKSLVSPVDGWKTPSNHQVSESMWLVKAWPADRAMGLFSSHIGS